MESAEVGASGGAEAERRADDSEERGAGTGIDPGIIINLSLGSLSHPRGIVRSGSDLSERSLGLANNGEYAENSISSKSKSSGDDVDMGDESCSLSITSWREEFVGRRQMGDGDDVARGRGRDRDRGSGSIL